MKNRTQRCIFPLTLIYPQLTPKLDPFDSLDTGLHSLFNLQAKVSFNCPWDLNLTYKINSFCPNLPGAPCPQPDTCHISYFDSYQNMVENISLFLKLTCANLCQCSTVFFNLSSSKSGQSLNNFAKYNPEYLRFDSIENAVKIRHCLKKNQNVVAVAFEKNTQKEE